jgi:collagenase-like PrtC family protease
MVKKPELIAPAGDWVSLRAAIAAGADGVYFGVKQLNMRANAKNFEIGEISRVVRVCHDKNVSAYLVLNTIIYDDEIEKVRKLLKEAKKAKVDAIVCWDYAVIDECEKLGLGIHLSTQSSISNSNEITFLKNKIKKLERIVLARELSLDQIKTIIKNTMSLFLELYDDHWSHYYTFGGKRLKAKRRLIGKERAAVIFINITIPVLLSYARKREDSQLEGRLFKSFKQHSKLSPN